MLRSPFFLRCVSSSCLTLALPFAAQALPSGGVVSGGVATIAASGPQLNVTQGSARAVIDWNSFNIGSGERVNIAQPSTSSILLNRIHDQQPSQIFGSLTANGRVVLANPNGMVFQPGSRVDVASLIATTAGIDNQTFLNANNLIFNQLGNPSAVIANKGSITVHDGGLAALVAPNVENSGAIVARAGKIRLAGTDQFTFDLYGDGLLSIAASPQLQKALVVNNGTLDASGGRVIISAAQGAGIVDSAVNMNGIVEATGLTLANGATQAAGTVTVIGDHITLGNNAEIHADGPFGGGQVNIGGEYQGGGSLPWAKTVDVAATATITANAIDIGNGGKAVLWSSDSTRMEGRIEAKGGDRGGNGGTVETSSHGELDVQGSVDASSPHGTNGEWLLDPRNVTIQNGSGVAIPVGGGTIAAPANNYSINAASISAALTAGNNVKITTGGGGAQTGNMTVAGATIAKTGGAATTLTLEAKQNLDISGSSITSTSGVLNVILWPHDTNIAAGGYLRLDTTTITTNGGYLHMAGGLDDGSNGGVAADGRPDGFALSTTNGFGGIEINNAVNITTAGGSVLMQGDTTAANPTGNSGIGINDLSLNSGVGAITLLGKSRTVAASCCNNGVFITGSDFTASAGTIKITGTGAANSDYANGIQIEGGTTITGTGTAAILMNGTGGSGLGQGKTGLLIRGGAVISSNSGAITITGKAVVGGSDYNTGIDMEEAGTQITSVTGPINLTGTGKGTGTENDGIFLGLAALITSTGGAAGASTITLNGTGANGTDHNYGIHTMDAGTLISSINGTILLHGVGGTGTATDNTGLRISDGTSVTSTGTGALAANITLNGTGGAGDQVIDGVQITGAGAVISTVDGDIAINGTAGTATSWDPRGVVVFDGARIVSTGVGAGAGKITLIGTGGVSGYDASGLQLDGNSVATTAITSVDGAITLTGIGGGNGTGDNNSGTRIFSGMNITSTGSATIAVRGTGGTGTYDNNGIQMADAGTNISSVSGAISLLGTGGGSGTDDTNFGVSMKNASAIRSTGMGGTAATLTLTGTGGNGVDSNDGVHVDGATISTVDGALMLTGRGTGTGNGTGIFIGNTATVTSSGTATMSFTGTATAVGNGSGIVITDGATAVTSVDGNLSFTGIGLGNSTYDFGVTVRSNANVGSTGLGTILVNGTGSTTAGASFAAGIDLFDGSNFTSVNGDITLNGTGGGDPATTDNYGIWFEVNSFINSTGVGAGAAKITLHGIAGVGTDNNNGLMVSGAGISINSVDGAISLNGTGGGTGADNNGIWVLGGATINSTGAGAGAATISLTGTGGNGISGGNGILLTSAGTAINSGYGAISLIGTGGGTGDGSHGISITNSVALASTGTGAGAATITLTGTSGGNAGAQAEDGIVIASSTITSDSGAIQLTGTSVGWGYGIALGNGTEISSTGAATPATITLNGLGQFSAGVSIDNGGTLVTSLNGAIQLNGTSSGWGSGNQGVIIGGGSAITSTGTGASAATITLTGTGALFDDDNPGILIQDAGTTISTVDGAITLLGTGGGTGDRNFGITAVGTSLIESTGTGTITLTGTGASANGINVGIYIGDSTIRSVNGDMLFNGTGGLAATGGDNAGINFQNSLIQSTGVGAGAASITVNAQGGVGDDLQDGITFYGTTLLTSVDGDIVVNGHAGTATTGAARGIVLYNGAQITSTGAGAGAATITLNGTGGAISPSDATGIQIDGFGGNTTFISSAYGAINLTGTGAGGAAGTQANGIWIFSGGHLASTGVGATAATITLNGTAGPGTDAGSGIGINDASNAIASVDGNITLTGRSLGTGDYNAGVTLDLGAGIISTGSARMPLIFLLPALAALAISIILASACLAARRSAALMVR